jgi:hypothetical protein
MEAEEQLRSQRPRRIEVLAGQLGPYQKGAVTDDPRAVAWLDRPGGSKLVREVKE